MLHERLLSGLLGGAAALFLAPLAAAQDFYLDFNDAAGTPSSAYGAAAGPAGTWNALPPTVPIAPTTLTDAGGAATAVTFELTAGSAGWNGLGAWNYDNPDTTGDDEALMDDILDVGGGFPQAPSGVIVKVSGLAANTYDVYTYCFAPDNLLPGNGGYPWITLVDVPGATTGQTPVGAVDWPATGHVQGETYARHTITLAAGVDLFIVLDSDTSGANAGSYGSLNGIQIVESGGSASIYCTSRPSSLPSCTPTLSAPLVPITKGAANVVTATAAPAPGGSSPGILIFGKSLAPAPILVNFGELCLQGFNRAPSTIKAPGGTAGVCNGAYAFNLQTAINNATAAQAAPGDTIYFQAWYRDTPNAFGANLTNAIGDFVIQ